MIIALLCLCVAGLVISVDSLLKEREKRKKVESEQAEVLRVLEKFWQHERIHGRAPTSEELRLDLGPVEEDEYSRPDSDPTIRMMPAAKPWEGSP